MKNGRRADDGARMGYRKPLAADHRGLKLPFRFDFDVGTDDPQGQIVLGQKVTEVFGIPLNQEPRLVQRACEVRLEVFYKLFRSLRRQVSAGIGQKNIRHEALDRQSRTAINRIDCGLDLMKVVISEVGDTPQ